MKLYAGIDGGQSSTTAVVGDERGNVLGRGSAGPADEVAQESGSTRLRDALQGALAAALRDAKLAPNVRVEAVVAGISGYDGRITGAAPSFNTKRVALMHDAPIAHAAAFDGEPGVLIIAGTGSVAYGVAPGGESLTVGGWGYLFGDEGSAFWIACEALREAMAIEDHGDTDELWEDVAAAFGSPSLRRLTRDVYRGSISRDAIAAFAERVIELAPRNEAVRDIVLAGALALASQARLCAKRLHIKKARVAFTGGLMRSEWFSQAVTAALNEVAPKMVRVQPHREPVEGALLMALSLGDSM
jgi:N-acetylglucosamine kinase-like BadF-type ATPase